MSLDRGNAVRIDNLSVGGAIHDIQSIDGCAILRVNPRERDRNTRAIKGGENIVKQSEPVWSLNLDQGIHRVRFIIHADMGGKLDSWRQREATLTFRFFD